MNQEKKTQIDKAVLAQVTVESLVQKFSDVAHDLDNIADNKDAMIFHLKTFVQDAVELGIKSYEFLQQGMTWSRKVPTESEISVITAAYCQKIGIGIEQ